MHFSLLYAVMWIQLLMCGCVCLYDTVFHSLKFILEQEMLPPWAPHCLKHVEDWIKHAYPQSGNQEYELLVLFEIPCVGKVKKNLTLNKNQEKYFKLARLFR